MKYTIDIITRLQDNGDGGYTLYGYNSEDEMIEDHFLSDEMTPELREDILREDDPYENGYVGSDSIEIEIVDGVARLVKPLSFHAGQ